MSNTFETCNICGSNDLIKFCANCGSKCCNKCYELHDVNVCTYIKDSKCHLCEIHSELPNSVTGYCFQCQYLVCDLCQTFDDHDDHSIVGLTEAIFIIQSQQDTENDKKRSIETTFDIKKILETLKDQIENQYKKIVDCISEKKCKLLSELKEHNQYLEEYNTVRERDMQGVQEDMSELKSTRADTPIMFLHKWQSFAKQMNEIEKHKPADRLTFRCGLINKLNLDEQFGKLQHVDPHKDFYDKKVDNSVSMSDNSQTINDTYMVSRQYQEIKTKNQSLQREALDLRSELEKLKTDQNFMIQLSAETCWCVEYYTRELNDSLMYVNMKGRMRRLDNSHMDLYVVRMDYIKKQFQMIIEQGIQKEKEFCNTLREMAEQTNDFNSDINLKHSEIRKLKKTLKSKESH